MDRRDFLRITSGAALAAMAGNAAAAAAAAEAASPAPKGQIRLGIDCWSLHGFDWKVPQLLDWAAKLKLDVIQANPEDFETLDDAYLQKLKEQADRVGITIEVGLGGAGIYDRTNVSGRGQVNATDNFLTGIRTAKGLGTNVIKCFMGGGANRRRPVSIPEQIETTVKAFRSVRSQALDAGVKFALETHGDLLAREAKTVIEEAGTDFVGCCLDCGNPVTLGEDPLLTIEVLGPHTLTSHIRDSVVFEHPRGAAHQSVALGDGIIDLPAFVARFRELCPQASFLLEILTGSPAQVLPYLEPDYWKAFPTMPAADFARYIALAKRGHPFTGSMMIARGPNQPPEYAAAIKEQKRFDLERSLDYAKHTLDLGVRWRT